MNYGKRFIKDFDRPATEYIQRLSQFSTPDLCDVAGVYDCMISSIKPWVTLDKVIGPALTIRVPPGEGGIIPSAISVSKPGDVIIIDGKGNTGSAYWGDQRSSAALAQGVKGVIIDGAFRDIDDCEKIGLPIFAKALTSGSSGKSGTGEVNVPVSCGGVVVSPGDIVFADRNGVCIIPLAFISEVTQLLEKKFPS